MTVLENVETIAKWLKFHHSKSVKSVNIAGGFVRDKKYGLTPNDVDVVVILNDVSQEEANSIMEDLVFVLNMSTKASEVKIMKGYGEDDDVEITVDSFSDRLYGDVVFKLGDVKVDLLFSKFESLEQAVSKFDANINQFAIVDGEIVYLGKETEHPDDVGLVFMTECRFSITEERRAKMLNRFHQMYPKG
ncbi:nucleotidyltransferase [Proteus phage Myduc]|uniref:Putative nucleotidyl transferase n=1 Tax=Proteus phage Myduc TaxID=2650874 RepID=A0A5J6T7C9_9CAUD|nr:nucleotidyltransferase [Proteus phage Myduc]QFG06660.1 putative nucleotidyl transferase [Proteus phage Myduc]